MKSIILAISILFTTSIGISLAAYHYTIQARQTHLEQQISHIKYKNRKLQIEFEKLWKYATNLNIELEKLSNDKKT